MSEGGSERTCDEWREGDNEELRRESVGRRWSVDI